MLTRLLGSCLLASGITMLLFWAMTALIATEEFTIEPKPYISVEIVDVRQAQPEIREPHVKPVRHVIDPEPYVPQLPGESDGHLLIGPGHQETIDPIPRDGRKLLDLGPSDGDATPMVRIAPRYPDRALARGSEGRVLIEFTINASGSVEDARVILSEPRGVFDKAALEAVRQWRYSPKVKNGRPVERPGVRIVIPFRQDGDTARAR